MNRVVVLAAVALALGGVLWMKSRTSAHTPVAPPGERIAGPTEAVARTSVLLFADPREAEASCGCAEIIRLARGAGSVPGVGFRELDTRKGSAEARRYGVRVSPTVILTDAAGTETTRFEGESPDVIEKLGRAMQALQVEPGDE